MKAAINLLISVNLLGTLVLLPNRLLGMLRSIEVKFVQIFNAWEQIFQRVSSRLDQGFGLGTIQNSICKIHFIRGLYNVEHVLNIITQYPSQYVCSQVQ